MASFLDQQMEQLFILQLVSGVNFFLFNLYSTRRKPIEIKNSLFQWHRGRISLLHTPGCRELSPMEFHTLRHAFLCTPAASSVMLRQERNTWEIFHPQHKLSRRLRLITLQKKQLRIGIKQPPGSKTSATLMNMLAHCNRQLHPLLEA